MKAKLNFKLGNRGLLPEEEGVVDVVNATLRASAQRHGKKLKSSSIYTVRIVTPGLKPVLRATATGEEPVEWPLAAA